MADAPEPAAEPAPAANMSATQQAEPDPPTPPDPPQPADASPSCASSCALSPAHLAALYAGYSTPPHRVAPNAVVIHDGAEARSLRGHQIFGEPRRRARSEFVGGVLCSVELPPREGGGESPPEGHVRAILGVYAPPYSARFMLDNGGAPMDARPTGPFVADHTFERMSPPAPTDAADPDHLVRAVYARCRGCVARGYHLGADISCIAFGVRRPPARGFIDVERGEEVARMNPGEREQWEAEQARLRDEVRANRERNRGWMEARRDEWRMENAPGLERGGRWEWGGER